MYNCTANYINGKWVKSGAGTEHDIINPTTEMSIGKVAFGTPDDVDLAVAAARAAFESFSSWTVAQRLELLGSIVEAYKTRWNDIAAAITAEMGAPAEFSRAPRPVPDSGTSGLPLPRYRKWIWKKPWANPLC